MVTVFSSPSFPSPETIPLGPCSLKLMPRSMQALLITNDRIIVNSPCSTNVPLKTLATYSPPVLTILPSGTGLVLSRSPLKSFQLERMEKIAVGTSCSQCLVLELLDRDLFCVGSIVKSQVPVLHLVDNGKDKVFWQLSPDFSLCECEASSSLPHFSCLEARTCLETHHSASIAKVLRSLVLLQLQ